MTPSAEHNSATASSFDRRPSGTETVQILDLSQLDMSRVTPAQAEQMWNGLLDKGDYEGAQAFSEAYHQASESTKAELEDTQPYITRRGHAREFDYPETD